jgi:predicted nucleic acid-binding protein
VPKLLWDASALSKRYYKEIGSDTVNTLFAAVPAESMLTTFVSYAETASILRRKYNRGDISLANFHQSRF